MPKIRVLTSLVLLLTIIPIYGIHGEQQPNEELLLQQFLSIHEVEKELQRIAIEEASLLQQLDQLSNEINQQMSQMQNHKARAAKIAREYYTGDRNDLLLLLFSSNDLQQFLRTYDLVSYLFEKDQEHLIVFHQQVQQLQALYDEKEKQALEWNTLQKHLLAQKALLEELDSDLFSMMSGLSDQEKILLLQQQLIDNWEERGIPAFDLFLRTISNSMSGLATELKDHVTFSLTGAKVVITDQQFSDYLQRQNELFHDFRIQFEDDTLTFFGTYDSIALTMDGTYVLESADLVRFHIKQLKYNGFLLPTTTALALEEDYDLGIYPKLINDRLIIKKVTIADGNLEIIFSLNF